MKPSESTPGLSPVAAATSKMELTSREILRRTLVERVKANPSYSMRALSRQAGISPAMMSLVLSGKKQLSLENAYEISKRLGFDSKKRELFCLLVQSETAKNIELKHNLQTQIQESFPSEAGPNLSLEAFKVIAEWYHFVILEFTQIRGFPWDPAQMAKILDISTHEVKDALERLLQLEMIEEVPVGDPEYGFNRYHKTTLRFLVNPDGKATAINQFHQQMLAKASAAMTEQERRERFIGSETLAFDTNQIEAANDIIERCFSELIALAARSDQKDSVYHLGIQFFRATETSLEGKKVLKSTKGKRRSL